jgi:hypothetical protein
MLDYPISNNKKEEEGNFIRTVLHNNLYHVNVINTVQQDLWNNAKACLAMYIIGRKSENFKIHN